MGRIRKKYSRGEATTFISRKAAMRKLQLGITDFRRLCILTGIHPQEPVHKKIVNKGASTAKVYYHLKDIQLMAHEPIVQVFRRYKVWKRKLAHAREKADWNKAVRVQSNRPRYKLDDLVRQRYPTPLDAIRDLDDCLCMCFLFGQLPTRGAIRSAVVSTCRRLTVQFLHWVLAVRALRKVFISIKGYYFQAEVQGEPVTWCLPHCVGLQDPGDADFKVMQIFVEFYMTLLRFVNVRLYRSAGLRYPPALVGSPEEDFYETEVCQRGQECTYEFLASLNHPLVRVDDDAADDEDEEPPPAVEDLPPLPTDDSAGDSVTTQTAVAKMRDQQLLIQRQRRVFSGFKFFLGREVPREIVCFVLRCGGASGVSWPRLCGVGATFSQEEESITHEICDRPALPAERCLGRLYVQPQWLFDSFNFGRLMPTEDYLPGQPPPPHLSPFATESGVYQPPELAYFSGERLPDVEEEGEEEEEEDDVEEREEEVEDMEEDEDIQEKSVAELKAEKKKKDSERKLREKMLPKAHRELYKKIRFSEKRKAKEAKSLKAKRRRHDLEVAGGKKKRKATG